MASAAASRSTQASGKHNRIVERPLIRQNGGYSRWIPTDAVADGGWQVNSLPFRAAVDQASGRRVLEVQLRRGLPAHA